MLLPSDSEFVDICKYSDSSPFIEAVSSYIKQVLLFWYIQSIQYKDLS